MEWVKCDLCGLDDVESLLTGKDRLLGGEEEFGVVRCRNCGLIYTNPRPTREEISRYYPSQYSAFAFSQGGVAGLVRRTLLEREVRRVRSLIGGVRRVLEVGCGTGEYLAALHEVRGWSVMGLEPSPYAAQVARERGLEIVTGTLEEARLADEAFDLVILRHVLEHLPSPSHTLGEVRRLLADDGLCLLTLPDIGSWEARLIGRFWYELDLPRHLYHFTKKSLLNLLAKHRFRVRCIGHSHSPNIWIGSLRYALQEKGAPGFLTKWLRIENPFCLLLFAPLTLLLAVLGQGSRITVAAEKIAPSGDAAFSIPSFEGDRVR